MKEIHLFVLWQRARYQQEKILEDIGQRFQIVQEYAITWSPELVSSNFSRFYGTNLPNHSHKEQECGGGEFLLIVVKDNSPKYDIRDTSRGPETVNVNMFDAKALYRQWTNGGHKVHATNNMRETNHDLTLLLGTNVNDFLTQSADGPCEGIKHIHQDIVGSRGWESIHELFYVLNNTVQYAIMRGWGEVSSGQFLDHGDVDILTNDYDNIWWILNSEKDFCHPSRPKAVIKTEGQIYLLDIWDSRKNYYDPAWINEMLTTAAVQHGMKVLNPENDFYCLLYHCLTNKGHIAEDYLTRLETYKKMFSVENREWGAILVEFLKQKEYDIVECSDPSTPLKLKDTFVAKYANERGVLVKSIIPDIHNTQTFTSKVYKKPNSFIKTGSPFLITNEYEILSQFNDDEHFPRVIDYQKKKDESTIELSKKKGVNVFSFFQEKRHQKESYILSFISESLNILTKLYAKGIIHRDFNESNLLIEEDGDCCKVSLIDFGWAIDLKKEKKIITPIELGATLIPGLCYAKNSSDHNDFYALGALIKHMWPEILSVRKCASILCQISEGDYQEKTKIENALCKLRNLINRGFYSIDKFLVKFYQHRKSYILLRKIERFPRKLRRWEKYLTHAFGIK